MNKNSLKQQRQYEQYISEKQRLSQASKAKRNQAQQMAQASSKQKNKSIAPDRLSASKQKGTVEKAAQKQAKHIEKEWNIWKKLKNHKVIMNSISHKIKFMISIIIIQSLHKI